MNLKNKVTKLEAAFKAMSINECSTLEEDIKRMSPEERKRRIAELVYKYFDTIPGFDSQEDFVKRFVNMSDKEQGQVLGVEEEPEKWSKYITELLKRRNKFDKQ